MGLPSDGSEDWEVVALYTSPFNSWPSLSCTRSPSISFSWNGESWCIPLNELVSIICRSFASIVTSVSFTITLFKFSLSSNISSISTPRVAQDADDELSLPLSLFLSDLFREQCKLKFLLEHLQRLALFPCVFRQVYSVTTDNGANFVKCVALLVDEQEQERSDPYRISETIDSVVSGIEYDNELLQSWEDSDFDLNDENPVTIRGVKCAAHTL